MRLAKADAFQSLGLDRRNALWHALAHGAGAGNVRRGKRRQDTDADRGLFVDAPHDQSSATLIPLAPQEEVLADYRTAGLSLRAHPVAFYRPQLERLRIIRAEELATAPAGRQVRVAGLVLVRQRPGTAGGITFVTLEDETGVANLIVRPQVWEQYRQPALRAAALIAHGQLQREGQVIHVLVNKLEDLAALVGPLRSASRDFK
jgi:error-prone DNA polymerase